MLQPMKSSAALTNHINLTNLYNVMYRLQYSMWVLFVPVANKIIGLENSITIHLDYIVLIAYYITVKSSVVDGSGSSKK